MFKIHHYNQQIVILNTYLKLEIEKCDNPCFLTRIDRCTIKVWIV